MKTNKPTIENGIIIGGGPAGMAAAIYLARAGLNPLVFAGSPPGGQLTLTTEVENYPGFERILGSDLIEKMRQQVKKLGVRLIDSNVVKVDFSKRPFEIYLPESNYKDGSTKFLSQSVIIATGSKAMWLGLESETRLRGKGVSACATCDGFFFRNKVVGVVGGGDTALQEALTLTRFAQKVYIIHRRDSFRGCKNMQKKVLENPKIEVVWNAVVEEILGKNKVEGVKLVINKPNFLTSELASRHSSRPLVSRSSSESEESLRHSLAQTSTSRENLTSVKKLKLDGLFIAIGHKPDTDLFKEQLERDSGGYIVTHKSLFHTMTSTPGVFAAGDCTDKIYQQASVAAGMGAMAALDAERWLETKE